jgi:trehalose 6-phosphate synthase
MRQAVHGQLLQDGRVRLFERMLEVGSFPVSIDPRDFAQAKHVTRSVQARPTARRMIGIDRLDYTKGLPHKFRAYGDFLERFPEYRGDVVLTQIAPPTRESVEAYEDIRLELERLAGSINGRYGELDWVPIHYIHRPVPRETLGDIYRSSRIGLVTPLRDGMNLVCKEYVAAQDPADPGVLILSRFAGAAEELTEALLVNPYHLEEVSEAIRSALEMSLPERQARHASLNDSIRRNNTFQWCNSFLASLVQAHERQQVPPGWRPLETGWRSTEKVRAAFHKLQRAGDAAGSGEATQDRAARRRAAAAVREGS